MKTLILALCLVTTGCSTIGAIFDAQDPCQSRGRANYQYPSFCGAAGNGSVVTRGYYNNMPVYSSRYEAR